MDERTYSLYIVSTPIGNMDDISVRALDALRNCDFILCEDTRQSVKLTNHFGISKPLISYHKFNEGLTADGIADRLLAGQRACLISDAGTPLISDPGYTLVQKLIENNISFTVIPGANAVLPSVILSGFSTEHFLFYGFLDKQASKREKELIKILDSEYPVILYASPHELRRLLETIDRLSPKAQLCLNKELTKLHEESFHGTASQILSLLPDSPKGEYTIVTAGKSEDAPEELSDTQMDELFDSLTSSGMSGKEALKVISERTGIGKKELYSRYMKK